MTATVTWHVAAANIAAFVALLSLSYVLPQALKESMDARLITRIASTIFLVIGGLNRLSVATNGPANWWTDITQYAQPVVVIIFLIGLLADTARVVRHDREAFEMVYTNLGTEAGDRVAAIFRAVRGR